MSYISDPYSSPVIDKIHHERLIANLTRFSEKAKVPVDKILTPMGTKCKVEEVNIVKHFHKLYTVKGISGAFYTKSCSADIMERMQEFCGAFIRNYVDARIRTVQEVLSEIDQMGDCTGSVIAIPNFCGGVMPTSLQKSILSGWLLNRHTDRKLTIIYIDSPGLLKSEFKDIIAGHVDAHYHGITE